MIVDAVVFSGGHKYELQATCESGDWRAHYWRDGRPAGAAALDLPPDAPPEMVAAEAIMAKAYGFQGESEPRQALAPESRGFVKGLLAASIIWGGIAWLALLALRAAAR